MADTKVKDLTEKAIGAATDQVYLNDVVGGNLDKRMPLSGIRVTESQITDLQTYLTDITGEALSTISDVTITGIASGELLKWNGSAWINNTLAEAGISATGHSHTESDITDLGSYITASSSDTLTNKTIDANGTGNSITNIDLTADITNTLPIANGGTNLTTYTTGDILYSSATNVLSALAKGTANQVLTMDGTGTNIVWAASAAGFADPMTTRGDIIIRNASNVTDRLAVGTNGQVLTSDGTDISWGAAGAADNLGDHTATEIIKSVTFGLQGEEAGHTIIGTTASGAWTYTAPAADTHDFVVTGTGTIAQVAAAGLDVTGVITVSSTVDGRDIATDGTKLDGIEALADVTDITNVNAAAATTVGTITTGVWNGTTIAVANGGTGVTSSTGTTNVVLSGSPTIVTPTIASLTNMQHDHADAAGGGTLDVSAITAGSSLVEAAIPFVIDGGGSAITGAEIRGDVEVPFDCTIKSVRMFADQSGSIVVDIWKDTYANFPPTDADSITASAVPTISTAVKSEDATLTGWTTTLSKGDILRFNVDSATTVERVTVSLLVDRT